MKADKDLRGPGGAPRAGAAAAAWFRPALFALAWVFLAIGVAGVFLPLVPGTLFLILAGACFTRSSPRFETWLLDHPHFGPPVRAWRETGVVPRKAKVFACISLALSWLILLATDAPAFVIAICLAVFVAVAIYLVTRPER